MKMPKRPLKERTVTIWTDGLWSLMKPARKNRASAVVVAAAGALAAAAVDAVVAVAVLAVDAAAVGVAAVAAEAAGNHRVSPSR